MSALPGRACEDSVFNGLWFKTAAGAGGMGIGGPSCWVGGQVTFAGSLLVDPSSYELAQTHEGPWTQGGEVVVIPWSWEETGPVHREGLSDCLLQVGVGVVHQGPRGDCRGWRDEV